MSEQDKGLNHLREQVAQKVGDILQVCSSWERDSKIAEKFDPALTLVGDRFDGMCSDPSYDQEKVQTILTTVDGLLQKSDSYTPDNLRISTSVQELRTFTVMMRILPLLFDESFPSEDFNKFNQLVRNHSLPKCLTSNAEMSRLNISGGSAALTVFLDTLRDKKPLDEALGRVTREYLEPSMSDFQSEDDVNKIYEHLREEKDSTADGVMTELIEMNAFVEEALTSGHLDTGLDYLNRAWEDVLWQENHGKIQLSESDFKIRVKLWQTFSCSLAQEFVSAKDFFAIERKIDISGDNRKVCLANCVTVFTLLQPFVGQKDQEYLDLEYTKLSDEQAKSDFVMEEKWLKVNLGMIPLEKVAEIYKEIASLPPS